MESNNCNFIILGPNVTSSVTPVTQYDSKYYIYIEITFLINY